MLNIRRILLILWIFNILFILYQGSLNGDKSSETSGQVVEVVQNVLEEVRIEVDSNVLHALLRDLAHVIQYFILGIWTALLFIQKPIFYYVGFIVMLLDESIQYVTPGRAFELKDLGLDTMGYTLALIIVIVLYYIIKGRLLCAGLSGMLENKKQKKLS